MSSADAVTTLSRWAQDGVALDDVLEAIDALRRPEPMPATRTSVLTLCIVGSDMDQIARAQDAVRELAGRHPARVLHFVLDPTASSGAPGLDVEIRLLGGEAAGAELWFEEIDLVVHGPAAGHLDSLIEPLTLPDLPVVTWFVEEPPDPGDPLLRAADVLMVDSRALGGHDCLDTLELLADRTPIVDLSWIRLRPWRELLAGLFEGPDFRPFLRGVERAEVRGRTGPRHLLAGWLRDRLDLSGGTVTTADAEHVSLHLDCRVDGRTARFSVTRGDDRKVGAMAEIVGGPRLERSVPLPDATPAWGLADGLSRLERDPLYDRALQRTRA